MGAIFGIVGDGTSDEMQAMAERVPYRGRHVRIWSPAPSVLFGEATFDDDPSASHPTLAADLELDLNWRDCETYSRRERDRLSRSYITDFLAQRPAEIHAIPGLYAFALWNEADDTLLLAADRANYRRIYYVALSGRFAFASDYKSLLALDDCPAQPDREALQFYLATRHSIPGRANLAGIGMINGGRSVHVKGGRVVDERAWAPSAAPVRRSRAGHVTALRNTLLETVERMCAPHDRIAVTLSGGVDSAGLVGLLRHVAPDRQIATYTIGYGESDPDLLGARSVARELGTEHHEQIFDARRIPHDLPYLVWLMEQCCGQDESLLQFQLENRLYGQERVLMSGVGADAAFAGMPRHRLLRLGELLPFAWRPAIELFQQTQTGIRPGSLRGRALSYVAYRGQTMKAPNVLGTDGPQPIPAVENLAAYLARGIGRSDAFFYHAAIHDEGELETLMPYNSHQVVDLALTIRIKHKVDLLHQKTVLREALSAFIPPSVLKKKKGIQKLARDEHFRDVFETLADRYLTPDAIREHGIVPQRELDRVRQSNWRHPGAKEHFHRLWSLIVLEIWCRRFIDHRGRRPETF